MQWTFWQRKQAHWSMQSVISKKSETISLIWFKELAWTAQKAAFNSDRGWGRRAEITHWGQETRRNLQPTFSSLCWRNYNREEISENWQHNPLCYRNLLLHHPEGCPAKILTLHPCNPSSSHAISKDPTNLREKTRIFFCFKFQLVTVDQRKSFRQHEKELQWKNPRLPRGSRRHLVGTARGQMDTRTEMKTSISFSSWFL